MYTCEAMFLLLTTDSGKDEPWVAYRSEALRGALLADLAMLEAIEFGTETDPLIRLTAIADREHPHQAIRYGIRALEERVPISAADTVQSGWFSPQDAVAAELCERGIVQSKTSKFLFFSTEHFPTVDPEPEAQLRAGLASVIAGERAPSAKETVLLAILDEMAALRTVLRAETASLSGRQLTARVEELRAASKEDDDVTKAVATAIQVMQSFMSAMVMTTMP